MYLLHSCLLLLPLYTSLSNSSPTSPLVLPGHDVSNTTSLDVTFPLSNDTGFGTRFLNVSVTAKRPPSRDFMIDGKDGTIYKVRVGSSNPDTGNGDPVRVCQGLTMIYDMLPSLTRPDGRYPMTFVQTGSFGFSRKFRFEFKARAFRFDNSLETVRRFYLMSSLFYHSLGKEKIRT